MKAFSIHLPNNDLRSKGDKERRDTKKIRENVETVRENETQHIRTKGQGQPREGAHEERSMSVWSPGNGHHFSFPTVILRNMEQNWR